MLSLLLNSLVCGGLAFVLAGGAWCLIASDSEKLKQAGKPSVGSGFSSKALNIVFKVAIVFGFLVGAYMIAEGVWQFIACPR